jgi:23S rRNA pseudouridine2605 synthase
MQNDRKKFTSKEKSNSGNSDSSSSDEYKVVRKTDDSERSAPKPRTKKRSDTDSDLKPRAPRRDDGGSDFKPRGPKRDDERSQGGYKSRDSRRDNPDGDYKSREKRNFDTELKPLAPRTSTWTDRSDRSEKSGDNRGPRSGSSRSDRDFKPRDSNRRDDSDSRSRAPRRDDRAPRRDDRAPRRDDRAPRRDDRAPRRDDSNSTFSPRGPKLEDSKFFPRGPNREDRSSSRRDDGDFKPRGPKRDHRDRYDDDSSEFKHDTLTSQDGTWRLNKYIANSGVCGRREADQLISDGKVTVNGKVITELGTKVNNKDTVKVDGAEISPEDFTYLLLNKLKNYITTMDDEKGRSTVMDLVADATGLRVYPVGRLDRNTTGLLLMTNDGDLANRLMHPSYKVKKTYIVETSIALTDPQILEMRQGIMLDDGMAQAHEARRVPGSPNALKISIFEGRNRQIRRMIEFFKVEVIKLHRTYYAGLTVQDIRPGRWRFLKSEEVNNLRMLVKLFDLKQK